MTSDQAFAPPPSFMTILRRVLVLAVPLIGSHIAQFALHLTDTVMLGRYGVLPLAAGVMGASTFFVVFIFGSGFAKAVMPLVASAHAQGDETQQRRVTRMGLWLSTLFGVVIYPVFWWSEPLLLLLGQKPEVAALGGEFLQIVGLGMIPALLVMVLKSYLAALGRTQVVLWVTIAALPLNALLNYALVFGNLGAPELGVRGSGLATLSVQVLSLVMIVAYAAWLPSLRHHRLFQRFWRPDWQGMRAVFRLGLPMGLTGLAESGLFQASALMMGWIGTVELAAHGIAMEITALAFMVHLGLSNAVTVQAGRAYGAQNGTELRAVAKVSLVLAVGFALVVIAVLLLVPKPLVSLFIDAADPAHDRIVAMGVVLLACAALFHLADGIQVLALGLLSGIHDTKVPMWLATLSYWVIGIPASYLMAFPLGLGPVGLWLGLTVGLTVAAVTMMGRFWKLSRLQPAG